MIILKDFIRSGAEVFEPAAALIDRREFNALGLTDTAMAQLSEQAVIVTLDHRLAGTIQTNRGYAINFNHHRTRGASPVQ